MRLTAALIVVSVVCLAAAPAGASEWGMEKWAKQESAWKGHGIGSTTTTTTTMQMPQMPDMPAMPGMPKDGKMVTTTKTTLTEITDTGYVLSVETTSMGRTSKTTRAEPKVRTVNFDGQVKELGEEAVTVEGKSYSCKVKSVANMEAMIGDSMPQAGPRGAGMKPTMSQGKVWESPTEGVLKMETTAEMMGQQMEMAWQVSRLKASFTLGTESFSGREMTMTMKMQMGEMKMTILTSLGIPGGTLKSVMEAAMMGQNMTTTTELTAYVKKPLAVTTPAK